MSDKKILYQSKTLALPPLKLVLGDVPDPDPDGKSQSLRPFGNDKSESEAKSMVTRLIGHLKTNEK